MQIMNAVMFATNTLQQADIRSGKSGLDFRPTKFIRCYLLKPSTQLVKFHAMSASFQSSTAADLKLSSIRHCCTLTCAPWRHTVLADALLVIGCPSAAWSSWRYGSYCMCAT